SRFIACSPFARGRSSYSQRSFIRVPFPEWLFAVRSGAMHCVSGLEIAPSLDSVTVTASGAEIMQFAKVWRRVSESNRRMMVLQTLFSRYNFGTIWESKLAAVFGVSDTNEAPLYSHCPCLQSRWYEIREQAIFLVPVSKISNWIW